MDIATFLDRLYQNPQTGSAIAHVRQLPSRPARLARLARPLTHPILEVLRAGGIEQRYPHQVEEIELARADQDLVVVTGTASGKTLCYNLPVLESCLERPCSTALYIFPTKALCQDQLGTLNDFSSGHTMLVESVRPAIYDGDTPTTNRRRIKSEVNVLLTNPDMLHVG